jgi:hypothetical protein
MDEIERELRARTSFAARATALELLELHMPDGPSDARAAALQARLERANQRFAERLRSRIRSGRYTSAGLARAFAKLAEPTRFHDYDALDLLLASLLDIGPVPEGETALEPEMVRYQPTPAHAILALIERAVAPSDVVYDLGSGLGWVVILVALLSGARARGVEIEPAYVRYASECARELNLPRAEFSVADARVADFADATLFFLYTPFRGALLEQVLQRLQLLAATRPLRVASYGPCTHELARCSWLRPRASQLNEHELAVFDSVTP